MEAYNEITVELDITKLFNSMYNDYCNVIRAALKLLTTPPFGYKAGDGSYNLFPYVLRDILTGEGPLPHIFDDVINDAVHKRSGLMLNNIGELYVDNSTIDERNDRHLAVTADTASRCDGQKEQSSGTKSTQTDVRLDQIAKTLQGSVSSRR